MGSAYYVFFEVNYINIDVYASYHGLPLQKKF